MTTDKEVLKLALEALEDMAEFSPSRLEKQITAIKEALAQPEQEPVACVEAYALEDLSDGRLSSHTFLWNVNRKPVSTSLVDLYTTPPQRESSSPEAMTRKPLTFDHVERIVLEARVGGHGIGHTIARAVEAAHNIKE